MNQQISMNNYTMFNVNDINQYNNIPNITHQNNFGTNLNFRQLNFQRMANPVNYKQIYNNQNNVFYNNSFSGMNISDNNFNEFSMNNTDRISFRQNNYQNKNSGNSFDQIQGRFDELQNKINNLQNLLNKKGPIFQPEKKENLYTFQKMANNEYKSNLTVNNYGYYNETYKQNTYNPIFKRNNLNKGNFINNNKSRVLKDLNQLHNQMQNRNPRASLLKKMTQFYINDNNRNSRNFNNNNNINVNIPNNRQINNNIYMRNQNNEINDNNNNNLIYNINNYNNNNFISGKESNKNPINKTKNLNNFDINKYPHEIQQLQNLDDIGNNQNNNIYNLNRQQNIYRINNYNQFDKSNYNNKNDNEIHYNPMGNMNKNITNENEDNNDSSDNLSDLAEDLVANLNIPQENNNIKNINNSNSNIPNFQTNLNDNPNSNNIYSNKNYINNTKNIKNKDLKIPLINDKNEISSGHIFNNYNIVTRNLNLNNTNKFTNIKDNQKNFIENINSNNNTTTTNFSYQNNTNSNTENTEISLSQEIKDQLINKLNSIESKDKENFGQGYLLLASKNDDINNTTSLNNKNESKDIDIKINNINYQQNQISNSNIYVNVSYSKENQIPTEKTTDKSNNEIRDIQLKPKPPSINKELKTKRRIQINEDKNIIYHYKVDSSLEDYYQVFNKKNEELTEHKKKFMDLEEYMKSIKEKINSKPIIKKFDEKEIKLNNKYVLAENLTEEEIIPDIFEDDDEDIQSLKQSLERSIDKMFVHSLNEKVNDMPINDSQISENNNDIYSNKEGKILINKLQDMIQEDINEDNEENQGEEYTYEEDDDINDTKERIDRVI